MVATEPITVEIWLGREHVTIQGWAEKNHYTAAKYDGGGRMVLVWNGANKTTAMRWARRVLGIG